MKNRIILMMAAAALGLAAGAQAHGSGYWGPAVQKELCKATLKMGGYGDFTQFSDEEICYIAKMFGAPGKVLKSAYASRTWLACCTLKVMAEGN
jgi:hypothetical protein